MKDVNKKHLASIGEFGLIDLVKKMSKSTNKVIKNIGDDTAVLSYTKDKRLLFTTDMIAEGVHFKRSMGPKAIGYKALACSVSDIAAMGGLPLYGVISLAVPSSLKVSFVRSLYKGFDQLTKKFNFHIVGGDTVGHEHIIVNVALMGEVKKDELVLRSGAKKSDMIFVTGPLGRSFRSGKHLTFAPRINESQYLVRYYKPNSMIDVSDGLAGDLSHILKASKKGAVLYEKQIPRSKGATLRSALYEGEDFELLFTVSKDSGRRLLKNKNKRFYYIGDIVDKSKELTLVEKDGTSGKITISGYTHF